MPTAQAKKLCPQLVVLPTTMWKYKEASQAIRNIFDSYTKLVQPLSLDEAFLDVSQSDLCSGSATWIANSIKQRVRKEVGITVSAGVAPNKFLAKVASDWNKPDGLFVIEPKSVDGFVQQLPVNKLHGVGKVTEGKLKRSGIYTCGDIRAYSKNEFLQRHGNFGAHLYELAQGIDHRPVKPDQTRKSLSVEHTYSKDLPTLKACYQALPELLDSLRLRLRRSKDDKNRQVNKLFIKLKFSNFTSTTMETINQQINPRVYNSLCKQAFERQGLPVRLLGVGVRFVEGNTAPNQLCLDF